MVVISKKLSLVQGLIHAWAWSLLTVGFGQWWEWEKCAKARMPPWFPSHVSCRVPDLQTIHATCERRIFISHDVLISWVVSLGHSKSLFLLFFQPFKRLWFLHGSEKNLFCVYQAQTVQEYEHSGCCWEEKVWAPPKLVCCSMWMLVAHVQWLIINSFRHWMNLLKNPS